MLTVLFLVGFKMIEIEVKVCARHAGVKPHLLGMGATEVKVELHEDVYYNAPHRDFGVTDEALRIRSMDGTSYMTYKGKKLDRLSKTREEFETAVEGEQARSILEALGFVRSGVVRKRREVLKLEDITICLDRVEGLGEFLEVETVADSNIDGHRDALFVLLEKIGIKKEASIRTSYLEMLMENQEESESKDGQEESELQI